MYTSVQVAEAIGCARGTVAQKARKHGIGFKIGPGRTSARLFSETDLLCLQKLIRDRPGRPWPKKVCPE
jgi:hypothetical protein